MSSGRTPSDAQMTQPSVAILGAGLSGLTLGRCLRQRGISSVIYDRASSSPRHTYAITLQPWAYKPLLNALDLDENTFRGRVAVDSIINNGAGRISKGDMTTSTPFRANRHKLESILREGQNIHLEHSLSAAAIQGDGDGVELVFQNGRKLRPGLVVDAEGVHSQLRKTLLPEIALEVQPFAVYRDGNVLVREADRSRAPRLEITVNEHQPNGTVSISYIYSRAARNEGGIDPLHHPERPIAGATDIPEEFYEEVEDFIKSCNPGQPFEDCFDVDQIRSERLLHWLMRAIIIPKEELLRLLQYGIVMIGDSVHAVPILGGHGANMAILDAIRLAEILGKGDALTQIEGFYETNWQGWRDAVEESKRALVEMHNSDIRTAPSL